MPPSWKAARHCLLLSATLVASASHLAQAQIPWTIVAEDGVNDWFATEVAVPAATEFRVRVLQVGRGTRPFDFESFDRFPRTLDLPSDRLFASFDRADLIQSRDTGRPLTFQTKRHGYVLHTYGSRRRGYEVGNLEAKGDSYRISFRNGTLVEITLRLPEIGLKLPRALHQPGNAPVRHQRPETIDAVVRQAGLHQRSFPTGEFTSDQYDPMLLSMQWSQITPELHRLFQGDLDVPLESGPSYELSMSFVWLNRPHEPARMSIALHSAAPEGVRRELVRYFGFKPDVFRATWVPPQAGFDVTPRTFRRKFQDGHTIDIVAVRAAVQDILVREAAINNAAKALGGSIRPIKSPIRLTNDRAFVISEWQKHSSDRNINRYWRLSFDLHHVRDDAWTVEFNVDLGYRYKQSSQQIRKESDSTRADLLFVNLSGAPERGIRQFSALGRLDNAFANAVMDRLFGGKIPRR